MVIGRNISGYSLRRVYHDGNHFKNKKITIFQCLRKHPFLMKNNVSSSYFPQSRRTVTDHQEPVSVMEIKIPVCRFDVVGVGVSDSVRLVGSTTRYSVHRMYFDGSCIDIPLNILRLWGVLRLCNILGLPGILAFRA